ncbi:MAG: hypothetical protein JST89_06515 [Cyanobacteria bacterium SZAS-4]|nr:hypothetical protein [Cyanobacteria bacterium SZAS-4]
MNTTEYNSIVKTLEIIRVFSSSIDKTNCCEAADKAPHQEKPAIKA